jgi:hypothetical protein
MAQPIIFKTTGALRVVKGRAYTIANLPTVTPAVNTIKIGEAPIIWRKVYNKNGETEQEKGVDKYIKGNQRGVWLLITRSGVTYGTGDDANIPSLYKEGDEIALDSLNTYTFLQTCIIEYGNL